MREKRVVPLAEVDAWLKPEEGKTLAARKRCGCISWVQSLSPALSSFARDGVAPEIRKQNIAEDRGLVRRSIRNGLALSRIDSADVRRALPWKCPEHKALAERLAREESADAR